MWWTFSLSLVPTPWRRKMKVKDLIQDQSITHIINPLPTPPPKLSLLNNVQDEQWDRLKEKKFQCPHSDW